MSNKQNDTFNEHQEEMKSNCCQASIRVVGGDEGTNHYECTNCKQGCDILSEETKSDWEKEWLAFKNRDYGKHPNLWIYGKKLTIAITKSFIRQIREQAKQEGIEVTGETSDGYHTFNELYEFRKLYNAVLFNEWANGWKEGFAVKYDVHKSKRHSDGEECFSGGWFIVMAETSTGQISNHYEMKDWNLFNIPEKEKANKWDGCTPIDVLKRLRELSELKKKGNK